MGNITKIEKPVRT